MLPKVDLPHTEGSSSPFSRKWHLGSPLFLASILWWWYRSLRCCTSPGGALASNSRPENSLCAWRYLGMSSGQCVSLWVTPKPGPLWLASLWRFRGPTSAATVTPPNSELPKGHFYCSQRQSKRKWCFFSPQRVSIYGLFIVRHSTALGSDSSIFPSSVRTKGSAKQTPFQESLCGINWEGAHWPALNNSLDIWARLSNLCWEKGYPAPLLSPAKEICQGPVCLQTPQSQLKCLWPLSCLLVRYK